MAAGKARGRLSAESMSWWIAMPGAISTNSEATPGTGKKPREVVPISAASCGCSESKKT